MKEVNEKGQILIFVTLAFVLLGLFVGLAVDGGRAYVLRADLARKVDPAALAAAAAYRDASDLPAATTAACNSAKMNGLDCAGLSVTQQTVTQPDGSTATGVRVAANATMPTSFIRLGTLIGCSICDSVNVAAAAVAVPGGNFDLVMNLDDTNSMQGSKLTGAKNGANQLVDTVVPAGGDSTAKVSMAPFRGCYNSNGASNCKDTDEYPTSGGSVVSLPAGTTNNNAALHGAIKVLTGTGGSGTNVCDGLTRARLELFESPGTQSRANASKFIILLTDADNNYNAGAAAFAAPGCVITGSSAAADRDVGLRTYNLATDIKMGQNVGTSGQPVGKMVIIFVILYGSGTGAAPACNSSMITNPSQNPETTTYWINLASCIATSPGHVYKAPTGPEIQAAFQEIISRLPVRLVL